MQTSLNARCRLVPTSCIYGGLTVYYFKTILLEIICDCSEMENCEQINEDNVSTDTSDGSVPVPVPVPKRFRFRFQNGSGSGSGSKTVPVPVPEKF